VTIDASKLRQAMVDALVGQGILKSPRWSAAFSAVPREVFVPRYHVRRDEWSRPELIEPGDEAARYDWLRRIYDQNETLVTQVDPATEASTSSSTMPRIVAAMLEALELEPGHDVLEVGTGSGYSTALLCEYLGAARVTSVDVDPELVEAASLRLAALGYMPHLTATDGFCGYPSREPYDRIIATCQAPHVPLAWVQQTRPNGLILAVLSDVMVRLTADGSGGAAGRFHSFPVSFMWMRGHSPDRLPPEALAALTDSTAPSRRARVDVMAVLRGERIPSLWPIALTTFIPFYARLPAPPGQIAFADLADRSWVVVDLDGSEVRQGGPRRLWDQIEDFYELLDRNGRPERERFGLTVQPDGKQFVWLDSPQRYRWELM
jgi:protein-L-isoaspartate(D-aspartate) O-methyltransferase